MPCTCEDCRICVLEEALAKAEAERDEARALVRESFRAGFVAHPDSESPVFVWSFDPRTCAATDREQEAWAAWQTRKGK